MTRPALHAAAAGAPALDVVNQATAGLRMALILFAVGALLAWVRGRGVHELADVYRGRAWALMAAAVVAYSPAHAAWLIGRPLPAVWSRPMDLIGTGLACASFVLIFAARGLERGLTAQRARRGMIVNLGVALAMAVSTWLFR